MKGIREEFSTRIFDNQPALHQKLKNFISQIQADYIQLIPEKALSDYKLLPSPAIAYKGSTPEPDLAKRISLVAAGLETGGVFHLAKADGKPFPATSSGYTHWVVLNLILEEEHLASLYIAFSQGYPAQQRTIAILKNTVLKNIKELNWPGTPNLDDYDPLDGVIRELTAISSRKEFQQFITTRLNEFIPYSACTFFLIDSQSPRMENFFFDSRTNLAAFPFSQSVPIQRIPQDDALDERYFRRDGLQVGEVFEGKDLSLYLNPESDFGKDAGIFLKIYSGNDRLGYCVMLFPASLDKHLHIRKIKMLLPHFSSTISRIKILEDAQQLKGNFDILERISVELALNKNKEEVLKALRPHLKSFFDFAHHFVAIINPDKLSISLLLRDLESKARTHPRYKNAIGVPFPISEQMVNKVLLSNEPVVFDLEFLASRSTLPEYIAINYESGIQKMAMVALQVGGERIGVWTICLSENQELSNPQLALIKTISRQISIAARDFQLAETLRDKKIEGDFLSQVSAHIAMISHKRDVEILLSQVLREKFIFQHVELLLLDQQGFYTSFLHTNPKEQSAVIESGSPFPQKYPATDALMSALLGSRDLYVFDVHQLIKRADIPQFVRDEYKQGIRKKIGFKLHHKGMISGVLFFNLSQNTFTDQEFELLSQIAMQISAALSNVLSNQEITERQSERELLFTLSTQIASVRTREQLTAVMSSELKEYFGFSHVAIAQLNAEKNAFEAFLFDPQSKSLHHMDYQSLIDKSFSLEDDFTSKILSKSEPVIFDLEEVSTELPLYIRINKESGIRQVLGIKFSRDSSDFGFMLMFFEQKQVHLDLRSGLVKAIAHHISTAVDNIVSSQQVSSLLNLRSQLLQFGNELRMAKDEQVLSSVLASQLKTLFGAENLLVTALSSSGDAHRALFFDPDSELAAFPEIHSWTRNYEEMEEGFYRDILQSNQPVILDSKAILNFKKLPRAIRALSTDGMDVVGATIKFGDDPVGMIIFQIPHPATLSSHTELFSSIRSQIAIVVVNMLSHQKVQLQLKEIEGYKARLEEEKIYLTNELETVSNYTEIVGQSPALKETFHLVSQVSASDSTVLILGETGTGKELIARAIHNNSPRKNKLMVKVNCAALPANLIESELFGHERGSFTGATDRRIGKFELANGGTLFLDEVGEMPLDLQVKLLRALQEKEVERVGGRGTIKVDVRIIAATNRDLLVEMEAGRFRSDLYYRLNIFPINLPPLRERKEDVELLIYHFINHFSKKCGKAIDSISSKALQDLLRYNWPGNVRELEHLIERSVLLASGNMIKEVLLPNIKEQHYEQSEQERDIIKTIDQNEKEHIYRVLQYCAGRIAGKGGAAEILGVPPTTLNSKIKRLGIKRGHSM